MAQRFMLEETRSSFWLQYEKKKMRECAGTLHNLASVFLIEEKEEIKGEQDRQNILLKRRLRENRVLMADHLKEIADIMQRTADEKVRILKFGEKKEKQMAKMFSAEGLIMEDFYLIEKGNGKKEAVIQIYQGHVQGKRKFYSAEEVAAFLSVILNIHFVPASRTPYFITDKPDYFYFEEDTKYMVLTGYAKSVKEGERVSGDTYAFFETDDKKFYAILSDGMGSGEKAKEDSEVVVEMAERFLEGGFSGSFTAKMINDALLTGSEGKNMSTLDMCSIDLYTGETNFLKVGAAYGLVKRDGYVEKISSLGLPLGVFYNLEMNQYRKKILDGDYVFLFSDGVLEHFQGEEGEEFLKEIVAQIPYQRPSEMAGHIMKHAISAAGGRMRDDMTVLVMGVWENEE